MHLRPPVLPEQVRDEFLKPPPNGYDLMFHIGLAGRGPLRLERCGHKLGYNMKDAKSRYAPLVIPQPKDFSRRGPDGRPVALIERAERERLANSELSTNVPGDSSAKQNHGFGGPSYDNFTDELNTDLDVSRIIQDTRQLGIEASTETYSFTLPLFSFSDIGIANYLFINGCWPLSGGFPLLLFVSRIQAKR